MPFISEFKKKFTLEERKQECERIRGKFTDKIPVIVEKLPNSELPPMDRKKFLVPDDIILGQFIQIIRKRINLNSQSSIFVFIGEQQKLISIGSPILTIYSENKDEDGFLYVFYTSENTFG